MTGLDTNVLVRYLTQDDPQQSRKANGVIDDAAARGERLQVDTVTPVSYTHLTLPTSDLV